jgi:hypothetical protein
MKEIESIDTNTKRTTLSQTEKKKTQPTYRPNTDNITLNQGKECPPQATSLKAGVIACGSSCWGMRLQRSRWCCWAGFDSRERALLLKSAPYM